jgi:hypothetical protein
LKFFSFFFPSFLFSLKTNTQLKHNPFL